MTTDAPSIVLCNGATAPKQARRTARPLRLEYRDTGSAQNIKLLLPNFVRTVSFLPPRVLDLLEIASYVFSADRFEVRGRKDDLEYHSWSRRFHFQIKVRDYTFWKQPKVQDLLARALCFMTGDKEYQFAFQAGHATPATSLFDREDFEIGQSVDTRVVLFSGGLDSLTGAVQCLQNSTDQICLVSHRSGQPSTARTQQRLFDALNRYYPHRVKHYAFHCSLKGIRANEETQRTRAFLYTSIAYALCHVLKQQKMYVYENGITAMNLPKRQDEMNARASRTTHPKTLRLLEGLFSEIEQAPVSIETPFFWKTKTDVFMAIAAMGRQDLITSAVSCNKTFQNLGQATHCGECSQCIDRRFAAYASRLDDVDDAGIYANDFIKDRMETGTTRTMVIDYVRQARSFAQWNIDHFYKEMLNELVPIADSIGEKCEDRAVERIWTLCRTHGEQVQTAIERMRQVHDSVYHAIAEGSFLHCVAQREYLKEPTERLVESICDRLKVALPTAFQKNPPKDENDFNDKVSAILNSDRDQYEREHPVIKFAMARAIPDHSSVQCDLLIESKYVRGSTSPSKASEGIAADLTKYSNRKHILFIVYDPDRSISDDARFKKDFENKGRCTICIVR